MLLDSEMQTVSVPIEKIQKARDLIVSVLNKKSKKLTLNQLQKVCGFLNFLCRCVIPGRVFTRRMYAHTAGVLKPYHHIKITSELRSDLEMWLDFLEFPSAYSRPIRGFLSYNRC